MRRYIVDHELLDWARFRNVDFPETAAKFQERGGGEVHALWDGERLVHGPEAVVERRSALSATLG